MAKNKAQHTVSTTKLSGTVIIQVTVLSRTVKHWPWYQVTWNNSRKPRKACCSQEHFPHWLLKTKVFPYSKRCSNTYSLEDIKLGWQLKS